MSSKGYYFTLQEKMLIHNILFHSANFCIHAVSVKLKLKSLLSYTSEQCLQKHDFLTLHTLATLDTIFALSHPCLNALSLGA